MPDNKTVFISYRRSTSSFIARSIFLDLREHGFDVFMDVESIDSGEFQSIILSQIAARAYFLLILTPGTFERSTEPGDWLRREIEYAMDLQRNIVPIFVNDFKFNRETKKYLTGKLVNLPSFNGLNISHDYFEEGMLKLRSRFLNRPVNENILPTPSDNVEVINERIETVISQLPPTHSELKAEEYLVRGLFKATENGDYKGAMEDLKQALLLNPNFGTQLEHFKIDKTAKKYVFVSYSHRDTAYMHRIKETFLDENFETWTDENLEPGTPIWTSAIGKAIESSHSLVVVMSPTAKESTWVEQELHYARIHNVPIFPLLVLGDERSSIPFMLIGSQWTDIRSRYVSGMARVIATIERNRNILL